MGGIFGQRGFPLFTLFRFRVRPFKMSRGGKTGTRAYKTNFSTKSLLLILNVEHSSQNLVQSTNVYICITNHRSTKEDYIVESKLLRSFNGFILPVVVAYLGQV